MKLTSFLTLATIAPLTTSQAALTTDLVGYYDFEETGTAGLANKAPGASGFNGSWSAATFDNGGPGFTGNATFNPGDGLSDRSTLLAGNALNIVDLDNEFMDLGISSVDVGSTFTISAWTYLAPGATNGSPRFHAFESSNNFDVSWGTTGNYSTTGRNDYVGYVENTAVPFNDQFTEEEWDHVLMTYDTSGTFAFSGLNIGRYRDGGSDRDWDGMIDEFALWDRALTADERTDAYNRGLNGQSLLVPEPFTSLLSIMAALSLLARRRR